jgi:hypothetical protein
MMSMVFHPETDGATECANHVIDNILQAVVKPDQSDWEKKLPMVEFAMNLSHNKSTEFAPFELNYRYLPTLKGLLNTTTTGLKPGIQAYTEEAQENLRQTHFANRSHREDPDFKQGDRVWLLTANLSMPKGQARKLLPLFIGPFTITEAWPDKSNYQLDLPQDMKQRNIHNIFHVHLLRPFFDNDTELCPGREAKHYYDYGEPDDLEWVVDKIVRHHWTGKKIKFNVRWSLGDTT